MRAAYYNVVDTVDKYRGMNIVVNKYALLILYKGVYLGMI